MSNKSSDFVLGSHRSSTHGLGCVLVRLVPRILGAHRLTPLRRRETHYFSHREPPCALPMERRVSRMLMR